jgi:hypothetical protein
LTVTPQGRDFTITETIDFNSEAPPTFTATGPLCPFGTFEDEVVGDRLRGHPRYDREVQSTNPHGHTCDDGSETFDAQKHVFLSR